jgi:cell division protein ZapA (FtsZ GTPase activity inhibitor)
LGADSKPSVRINIMDVEYFVTGYEDTEYLQQVAALVDRRMRLLNQMHKDLTPLRNAILAALNLADELLRTIKQLEQYQQEAAHFSREISDRSRRLAELCAERQREARS